MSDLYNTDVALWSEHQADLLRRRAAGQLVNDADLDWSNIAEEIEALGRSERSNLRSKITTVIEHLIKLQASPTADPRRGWKITIIRARGDIAELLNDSPSLRRFIPEMLAIQTQRARKEAMGWLAVYDEQPRVDIAGLTFTEDQVLSDWFPDDSA
jgi:uncharacterized protein DUF29